jgi:hypothetical protein
MGNLYGHVAYTNGIPIAKRMVRKDRFLREIFER